MTRLRGDHKLLLVPKVTAMNASRDVESALLARCSTVARQAVQAALDQREANVFQLAAMVVRSEFPAESKRLMQAGEQYFAAHPDDRLASAEVLRRGWVVSLPRLRDMLSRQLQLD
ncbi:MAG TPA: hypothetical protein VN259_17280 [Xanthomonadales bacterium]|nr:hypothetical protein [Xanthomonadales bacterium]